MQRCLDGEGKYRQLYFDTSIDSSGWTPYALERLIDVGGRLSFGQSHQILEGFGFELSCAELERTIAPYSESCRTEVEATLSADALKPLGKGDEGETGRVMVLEIDGVRVLGQPQAGKCDGIELKSAVIYPQECPSQRTMIADRLHSQDFLVLLSGLLRKADVKQHDVIRGIGDGAAWIKNNFDDLGISYTTDVYHATEYLDKVMIAMDWDEKRRAKHRRRWCQGKSSARSWLKRHVPDAEVVQTWDKDYQTALNYLQERQDHMNYSSYKAQGFPIGSGQVEGMNKSVIGLRMKQSGMHWSLSGAARMGSLRAQLCSKQPIVDFHDLRHKAFPVIQC